MSIKNSIKDGTGSDLEAKVKISGSADEASLCVNIAGNTSGTTVAVSPFAAGGQYEVYLTLNGAGTNDEMGGVNHTITPVEYSINAIEGKDLIVTAISILGLDASIKMDGFMGNNSPLSVGSILDIKSDNKQATLSTIKSTFDILAFSSEGGFDIFYDNAGDSLRSLRRDTPLYIIRAKDTFGTAAGQDDHISYTLSDSLLGVPSYKIQVRGFLAEPGVF